VTEAQDHPVIGTPTEWKHFVARNPLFAGRHHRINDACTAILGRTLHRADLRDKAIFFTGHRIADDFMEIVVLAGNGEGRGAQKLLRPMFEQLVTLKYLIKHPDEFENYWNYFPVDRRKLAKAIESTLGPGVLGKDTIAAVESEFEKVKSKYQVTDCKTCGTTRLAYAWTTVDLVTMAKEVGVEKYLAQGYYLPLDQSHPKVGGLLSRLVETDTGGIAAAPRIARDVADEATRIAHGMLILALAAQVDYFKLDSSSLVEELGTDFVNIWGPGDLSQQAPVE
jgi:uncharacterized protein DUF5677